MSDDVLKVWTVYDHPRDHPLHFVARLFTVDSRGTTITDDVMIADTIEPIREWMITHGLTRVAPAAEDDTKIVETWL